MKTRSETHFVAGALQVKFDVALYPGESDGDTTVSFEGVFAISGQDRQEFLSKLRALCYDYVI